MSLTPLTIISGANSCGKSAFLQSILMVAQTIQHQNAKIPLVLNGSTLALGSPELIINDDSRTKEIKIGFTYCPSSADKPKVLDAGSYYRYFESGPDERLKPIAESILESVAVDAVFQVDSETEAAEKIALHTGFVVNQSHLQVTAISLNGRTHKFDVTAIKSGSGAGEEYRCQMNDTQKRAVEHLLSQDHVHWYNEDKLSCRLRHFLPDRLQVKKNIGVNNVMALQKGAESLPGGIDIFNLSAADSQPEIMALTEHMREIMLRRLDDIPINDDEEMDAVRAIISSGSLKFRSKYEGVELQRLAVWHSLKILLDTDPEYIHACKDAIGRARKQEDDPEPKRVNPWWIAEPRDAMERFFTSSLLYLGPLREEPKSLYTSKMNFNADNIGCKGEFSAQVFLDNKDTIIKYVSPDCIESLEEVPVLVEGSLQEAVEVWAKYLTIAEKIIVEYIGRNGYRILVRQPGEGRDYDISDVGVGISQVLPILVMGLLSAEGSTILIEQPELHLHPKVQSRLADFFLSMIFAGKQCIAETHSEHIVNRLRHRIVQSPNSVVLRKNTSIYFADNPRGFSEYRRVEINDYGVIEEWPDGFFDQTRKEITATICAEALKKSTKINTN